jgi:hypothetical protein
MIDIIRIGARSGRKYGMRCTAQTAAAIAAPDI